MFIPYAKKERHKENPSKGPMREAREMAAAANLAEICLCVEKKRCQDQSLHLKYSLIGLFAISTTVARRKAVLCKTWVSIIRSFNQVDFKNRKKWFNVSTREIVYFFFGNREKLVG